MRTDQVFLEKTEIAERLDAPVLAGWQPMPPDLQVREWPASGANAV